MSDTSLQAYGQKCLEEDRALCQLSGKDFKYPNPDDVAFRYVMKSINEMQQKLDQIINTIDSRRD